MSIDSCIRGGMHAFSFSDDKCQKCRLSVEEIYRSRNVPLMGQPSDYIFPCDHKWVEYIGFREAFTFCEKCDAKLDKRFDANIEHFVVSSEEVLKQAFADFHNLLNKKKP